MIYASSLLTLFYAACFPIVKIVIAVYLCLQLIKILRNPIPYPGYLMISYRLKSWILYERSGKQRVYEKARIVIETGLFFLLELRQGWKKRYIVVFFDQIKGDSYRELNILIKLNKNS